MTFDGAAGKPVIAPHYGTSWAEAPKAVFCIRPAVEPSSTVVGFDRSTLRKPLVDECETESRLWSRLLWHSKPIMSFTLSHRPPALTKASMVHTSKVEKSDWDNAVKATAIRLIQYAICAGNIHKMVF